MNKYLMVTLVLMLLLLIVWLAGCIPPTASSPKSQKLLIVDAEVKQPIPAGIISLHYFPSRPEEPDPNHPRFTGNAHGEVTVQANPTPAIWQVQAEGYVEQQQVGQDGSTPARYRAVAYDEYAGVVYLYQLPEPVVTILISDQFTGLLIVNFLPASGFGYVPIDERNMGLAATDLQASYVQEVAGMRAFTVTPSVLNTVDLVVTPLLFDLHQKQLQVRQPSGVLPYREITQLGPLGRGVWVVAVPSNDSVLRRHGLFVGDHAQYLAFMVEK